MIRRLLTLFLVLLAALAPAAATASHVKVALVAETDRPAAGRPLTLAIDMRPDPGWHDYWINPGDAGVVTEAKWAMPAAITAPGALRYPVPQTLLVAGLMNHVYEGPHALLVETGVKAGTAAGTSLPISADLRWLACSATVCVPERATLAAILTVGDGAVPADRRAAFDRARAALPRPLGGVAHVERRGGLVRIGIPMPRGVALAAPHLFPVDDGEIDYPASQSFTRSGDMLVMETRPAPGRTAPPPPRFRAVLRLGPDKGVAFAVEPGAVPAAGVALVAGGEEAAPSPDGGFLIALGGALLGGLILNVMPCVFPILSLKALGLARSGGSQHAARAEALAYAAGVLAVCLALGGILLALRAGGSAAGWAFQLQNARVILLLLLLTVGIAFNLAGLFELPTISAGGSLASRGGALGAFWTGALAAFVATPCSGPFMAGAIGAALVLPVAAALAVFAGLGIGLALPFLLIGFVPALRRRLPKPGAWMDRLRRILSVPMFLTALGLAWILGEEAGVNAMALGLGAALLAALGMWWMGRRQADGRERAWWPALPALAVALATVAIVPRAPAIGAPVTASGDAQPFSEARLAALRAEGRPVFVYFTADWCLTCKVNEKAAIERPQVEAAFARAHVATLVGDWTNGDPEISRFLGANGRSGVPLYLFYPAGGEAQVLPQVLTAGTLTALAA